MAFRLEFPVDAKCDFGLIIEPILRNCLGFGERLERALDHAEAQIGEIRASANRMSFDRLSKNTCRVPAACREGRHLATGGAGFGGESSAAIPMVPRRVRPQVKSTHPRVGS